MFIELLFAILVGVFAGIITGLIPGIHINMVSLMLVSLSGYILGFIHPLTIAVFIVAMGVTHTFLDFIPSVFLGAPDADTALNVLPGHMLLMKGKGYEAVKLTVIGSLLALILTVIIIPFSVGLVGKIYIFLQPYIGYILIFVVAFMILKEKGHIKILWGLFVFLISGILGLITFNFPNLKQPLFPLLSGLFGTSTLLYSLNEDVMIPKQEITDEIRPEKIGFIKAIGAATFSGSLTGIFPGLGAAQAAIIAMQMVGKLGIYSFLILVGGINTVNFVYSLGTFYAIQKARNGAVVAILEIVKSIDSLDLSILLAAALVAGGLATYFAMFFSKVFAKNITKINYYKLVICVVIFIISMAIVMTGLTGLLILTVSTAIGMIAPILGVKRSNAMGCLLLPVIFYFIF